MGPGGPPSLAVLAANTVTTTWAAGRPFVRAHSHALGSTEFDHRRSTDARWSPVCSPAGDLVPVVYGGGNDVAAAAETVLRYREDGTRPPRMPLGKYSTWGWSSVAPRRDLLLVLLANPALARLGVTDEDLLRAGPPSYATTRRWAAGVLAALPNVDGLVWESRQADGHDALVLFGSCPSRPGVARDDLEAHGPTVPFTSESGLERLYEIATRLGSVVVAP